MSSTIACPKHVQVHVSFKPQWITGKRANLQNHVHTVKLAIQNTSSNEPSIAYYDNLCPELKSSVNWCGYLFQSVTIIWLDLHHSIQVFGCTADDQAEHAHIVGVQSEWYSTPHASKRQLLLHLIYEDLWLVQKYDIVAFDTNIRLAYTAVVTLCSW